MKVLMLTPYVTINDRTEFSKNKTGFGYMVYDIARAVAQTEQVDVLASDSRGPEFVKDRVRFLKRSMVLSFLYCFRCQPLSLVLRLLKQYKIQSGSKLRLFYYWFISGYYRSIICKGNYDVVQIHGCSFFTELWMQVCNRCNQKFVVTLHGLNSFSDSVCLSTSGKQYERDFLKRVVEEEFTITVISTGMKHLIEKSYGVGDSDNIKVVCNSFNFSDENILTLSVREKYGIPTDARVLLYVGNISVNKNQTQLVEAFDLLPEELRNYTWALFCGENHMGHDSSFEDAVRNSPSAKQLIVCGGINKDLMPAYYQAADAVVLLSKAEGFGLSLIEGMYFGLPGLMFTDMDAYEDIYDENAIVGVANRDNQSVAEGIELLLTKQWNKDLIKASSKRFDSETMAKNYIKVFKQ